MNSRKVFFVTGMLIILVVFLAGCASNEKISQLDRSIYNSLLGNEGTYSDTEAQASGGVANNKDAHVKAQQALNQRNIDQALYYYVKALEFNQNDVNALLALARIHKAQNNLEPTILAYRLILDIEPEHIGAMEGAGLTLLKINKANQAKSLLDKVNGKAPNRPLTLMGIAVYYDLVSDFDAANQYYINAAKLAPNSVQILNNYAYSRYLAGYWEEAENIYRKLLRMDPKHPQAILNYGLLQARKGETTESLRTLKVILSEPEAYNEIGYIYMMQQDYGKARRMFELAISTSPTYFESASKNLEQLKLLVSRFTKTGTNNPDTGKSDNNK